MKIDWRRLGALGTYAQKGYASLKLTKAWTDLVHQAHLKNFLMTIGITVLLMEQMHPLEMKYRRKLRNLKVEDGQKGTLFVLTVKDPRPRKYDNTDRLSSYLLHLHSLVISREMKTWNGYLEEPGQTENIIEDQDVSKALREVKGSMNRVVLTAVAEAPSIVRMILVNYHRSPGTSRHHQLTEVRPRIAYPSLSVVCTRATCGPFS